MTLGVVDAAGVAIGYRDVGSGSKAALVIHGFTGTAGSMDDLISALSPTHRVVAPDLVGHGSSDAPATVSDYTTAAHLRQLVALLDGLGIGRVDVVGYSLGGRLGLSLACEHPDRVGRLALIGSTAGIDDDDERATRRRADEALADQIEAEGVEAFVDRWEQLPIFATQRSLPAETRARIRATRLGQRAQGLANSLRGCGAGVMPPRWAELGGLSQPVLVIVGALDDKYVALGRRLQAELPDAAIRSVPGVGHAVHVEAPHECGRLVAGFLGS